MTFKPNTFGGEFAGEDARRRIVKLFSPSIAGEAVPVTAFCACSGDPQATAPWRVDKLIQIGSNSKVLAANDRRRSVLAYSGEARAKVPENQRYLDFYPRPVA